MQNIQYENFFKIRFLLNIDGIGPQKLLTLLSKFEGVNEILSSSVSELSEIEGISKNLAVNILNSSQNLPEIESILEKELDILEKINADVITIFDDEYPEILKKIYFPPLTLYIIGELLPIDEYSLAIVGTRNPTMYGKNITRKFAGELAANNITIISGLARGIDSISHDAALSAGGRTIAVTGSGPDVIYPPENRKLFEMIKESGAIITEFEPGTKPDAQNFPRRNRIISGLSLGTLVIESALKGGAMQTAAYSLDQNREVFAIPGNLGVEQSTGTNILIQKGEARLVNKPEDIIEELQVKLKPVLKRTVVKPVIELNLFEEKIFSLLNEKPLQIDEISVKSEISTSDCLVHLLSLEFKGLVRQMPGKVFAAI